METTNTKNLLQSLIESFAQNAAIKKVYGEPIDTQGKTIITVAKVSQGFGGGYGGKNDDAPSAPAGNAPTGNKPGKAGEGAGMGGGMSITPIGILEITADETKFIRFDTTRYIALGAALGIAISTWWYRSRNRRLLSKKEKKQKKS
ncbi:spore germination protein GerW family protein [Botryobacter ruber]|uniref:spore germination protein GerW family protein n=1 Tax=Botryobacter ruber TaxID=2171629 RepID=UPI000E0C7449|nr:spore germination protein GerW family protein [Botryobacter ruber]